MVPHGTVEIDAERGDLDNIKGLVYGLVGDGILLLIRPGEVRVDPWPSADGSRVRVLIEGVVLDGSLAPSKATATCAACGAPFGDPHYGECPNRQVVYP